MNPENEEFKMEGLLCATYSGLLQTCIDIPLKATEEWCTLTSCHIVSCAQGFLGEKMLQATEGMTKENLCCCDNFVKAYIPNINFPKDLDDASTKVYQRWNWYIQAKGIAKDYFLIVSNLRPSRVTLGGARDNQEELNLQGRGHGCD